MDSALGAMEAVTEYGFTSRGDGSLYADLSPAAEYDDLVRLHTIARKWGYSVELDHQQPAADRFILTVKPADD